MNKLFFIRVKNEYIRKITLIFEQVNYTYNEI
ncbi:hypothetical protein C8P67_11286 [Flavobacterium aquicola]|uniref:Uncharacterized protein n=1 Tax=Flavobacterium aquicola TaxID=1682742 RepID=A0A3E0E979_9FLAO|nr:hypothetical protein C8P67_11286 [Flavobacterium aquicola]